MENQELRRDIYEYGIESPAYDEQRDAGVPVPGLATDIGEAMVTGTVVDIGVALGQNYLEDTDDIHGRVTDIFEALEYAKNKAKAAALKTSAPAAPGDVSTSSAGEQS